MKNEKRNVLFVVILVLVVTISSTIAFEYGLEIGGNYKSTYTDVYREAYYTGLEDGYTTAFLGIIVYNQSIDTAVKLGYISPDNINIDFYRKVWKKYIEGGYEKQNE